MRRGLRSHSLPEHSIRRSELVCFSGDLAKAEPKTIRYRVLHVAALLVRRGPHNHASP